MRGSSGAAGAAASGEGAAAARAAAARAAAWGVGAPGVCPGVCPGVWAVGPRSRELAGGVGCGCGERAAAVYGPSIAAVECESGGATGGGRWGDWWEGCGAATVPGGAEA